MQIDSSPMPLSESTYYILLSLATGPKHGYAIMKASGELSTGKVSLSVSTLYTALGRLQEQQLIERVDPIAAEPAPGLPRKVYRLTRPGQKALAAEVLRLKNLLSAYRQQLGPESA